MVAKPGEKRMAIRQKQIFRGTYLPRLAAEWSKSVRA
jgi:hypothetical protein